MRDERPASEIRDYVCGTHTVVELSGEIDTVSRPLIATHLDSLTCPPAPDVVVDLRKVTFIDCSGLSALCRAHTRARNCGGQLRLVCTDPRTLRTLRLTGLLAHFTIMRRLPEPSRTVGAQ